MPKIILLRKYMDKLEQSFVTKSGPAMNLGNKKFYNFSTTQIVVIFVILAFLGFNIFTYLGKTTDVLSDIFRPIISKLASLLGYTLSRTTELTAQGTKIGTDIASSAIKTGVDVTSGAITGGLSTLEQNIQKPKQFLNQKNMGKKELDFNRESSNNMQFLSNVKPVESDVNETGKKGFCYIGTEKDIRVCASVGVNDKCMSGEVFPSQEICMNPSLRE
jgi:hypothetical protein